MANSIALFRSSREGVPQTQRYTQSLYIHITSRAPQSFWFFCSYSPCPMEIKGRTSTDFSGGWIRLLMRFQKLRKVYSLLITSVNQMQDELDNWVSYPNCNHCNSKGERELVTYTRTRGHSMKMKGSKFKTNKRKYFCHMIHNVLWNSLSQDIIEPKKLMSMK